MTTEYIYLDVNFYHQLYGAYPTTLNLDSFLKLPKGTVFFDIGTNTLCKLSNFSPPAVITIETSSFTIDARYNPTPVSSKKVNISCPSTFYVTPFNTVSTFKLIKKGSETAYTIQDRYKFLILDEKLTSAIIPKYTSINLLVKANNQYNDLINANPSLFNLMPEQVTNESTQAI